MDLIDETITLIEIGILLPWVESVRGINCTAFLLFLILILCTGMLILSESYSIIYFGFVNFLGLLLLLLGYLVRYSQCQDSLLNKVDFGLHFDHNPLCNLLLLIRVKVESCLEELEDFKGLDVELQVTKLHQAIKVLLRCLKSRQYIKWLQEEK